MNRENLVVDIFDYGDFRQYLADWIEAARRLDDRISHRWFARRLGSENPSLLSHILSGRRPLASERVPEFVQILGLRDMEAQYFTALVDFGQATNADVAAEAFSRLADLRSQHNSHTLQEDTFAFTSTWFIPAVHELVKFPDFNPDPAWIAARTDPPITEEQARHAVEVNLRLGLLREENGRIVSALPKVSTPERVAYLATWPYHRDGLELAGRGLNHLFSEPGYHDRSAFLGATLAVPSQNLAELRRIMYQALFRLARVSDDATDPHDTVVHVTLTMVPVSKAPRGEETED